MHTMKQNKEALFLTLNTAVMTVREIADTIGAHPYYVRHLLSKHCLEARRAGRINDPSFIQLIKDKAEQGLTITDAARDLKLSTQRLNTISKRNKIRFGRKLRVSTSGAPTKIIAVIAALFHGPQRSNAEIGRELGVSREYVSQVRVAMRNHEITKFLNAPSAALSNTP